MTDKEKTIKELKEVLDNLDITNKYRLNLIKAIEYLQEEPVSEDLEKVAELYTLDDSIKPWRNLTKEAFIAGAKWKKQKIVDKACKWIDENAAKYLVDRFVGSTRVVGIDTSITEDFRKDMEDEDKH